MGLSLPYSSTMAAEDAEKAERAARLLTCPARRFRFSVESLETAKPLPGAASLFAEGDF